MLVERPAGWISSAASAPSMDPEYGGSPRAAVRARTQPRGAALATRRTIGRPWLCAGVADGGSQDPTLDVPTLDVEPG